MQCSTPIRETYTTFGLFCGIGGGLIGMNRSAFDFLSNNRMFSVNMQCVGGIDNVTECIHDFNRFTCAKGTLLDLFSYEQYCAWHGYMPPAGWREAQPGDIRKAAGGHFPDVVFTSPPCKGFSGLMGAQKAKADKYQALNGLTIRGIMLTLDAFKDDLPSFIIMENVPRISSRGSNFLNAIKQLLHAYGYAVSATTHDCGLIGGMSSSRKRMLLIARNTHKVPSFLYEPEHRAHRSIGDLFARLPLPGDPRAGDMHILPKLSRSTALRLAMVEAGKDWRSLNQLNVVDGYLADYALAPSDSGINGELKVMANISHQPYSKSWMPIADPRMFGERRSAYQTAGHYGVRDWTDTAGAVTSSGKYDSGPWSVADPRLAGRVNPGNEQIIAPSGHVHRPMTLYELAALQNLFDPEDGLNFELSGKSQAQKREAIGNAVPPVAGEMIGNEIARAICMSRRGITFELRHTPIWVRPIAASIALDTSTYDHMLYGGTC